VPQTHASAECVAMTSAQGAFDVVDAPLVIEEMDKFANRSVSDAVEMAEPALLRIVVVVAKGTTEFDVRPRYVCKDV